ncbi:hypothetical protein N8083_00605 [Candidatus Pacebacteria bacterium]|nr:hypothetical protein [Candidatus Paceibacterota bacterium]
MKTLKCDLCDHEAQGETFEAWMETLKPHYMEAHADVMSAKNGTPEEMREQMGKWMPKIRRGLMQRRTQKSAKNKPYHNMIRFIFNFYWLGRC